MTANAWNHVALTFNSVAGQLQLFVNGAVADTGLAQAMNGHNPATLGSARQGTRFSDGAGGIINSTAADSYHGYVDDVRIYGRELSAQDVALLASATLGLPVL